MDKPTALSWTEPSVQICLCLDWTHVLQEWRSLQVRDTLSDGYTWGAVRVCADLTQLSGRSHYTNVAKGTTLTSFCIQWPVREGAVQMGCSMFSMDSLSQRVLLMFECCLHQRDAPPCAENVITGAKVRTCKNEKAEMLIIFCKCSQVRTLHDNFIIFLVKC